jgi:hypothetical protein
MTFTCLLRATEMAKRYLPTTPDFSKVPSFVGYCAFIARSVHGIMLDLKDTCLAPALRTNAIVCLIILEELKIYWPILSFMVHTHLLSSRIFSIITLD